MKFGLLISISKLTYNL